MLVSGKLKKIFKIKAYYPIAALVFLFLAVPGVVSAEDVSTAVGQIIASGADKTAGFFTAPLAIMISWMISLFVMFMGYLSTLATYVLLQIAQYNDFITEPIVVEVWTILRDFANMGFVVILLYAAFSIILQSNNYQLEKLLPKVALMAIVINYSRALCAIIIEPAQLVMLLFFSVLTGGNGANMVNALGMKDFFSMKAAVEHLSYFTNGIESNTLAIASQIFGMVLLVTATIIIIVYAIALFMRIVKIWVYTIFSPLAALAWVFPGMQSSFNKWKTGFVNAVLCGPIMAFYLWFALLVGNTKGKFMAGAGLFQDADGFGQGFIAGFLNNIVAGDLSPLFRFIFVNMILLHGLKTSQQMCGEGSKAVFSWGDRMIGKVDAKAMAPVNAAYGWVGDKFAAATDFVGDKFVKKPLGRVWDAEKSLAAGADRALGGLVNKKMMGGNAAGLEQRGLVMGGIHGAAGVYDKTKKGVLDTMAKSNVSVIRSIGRDAQTNKMLLDHQRAGLDIAGSGIAGYRGKRYRRNGDAWYRVNDKNEWVDGSGNKLSPEQINDLEANGARATDEAGIHVDGDNMNTFAPIVNRDGVKMRYNHHTKGFAHVDKNGDFINENGKAIADLYTAQKSFLHTNGKQYHILSDNRVVDDDVNEISRVATEGDDIGGFEINGRKLFVKENMIADTNGALHGKMIDVEPGIIGVDAANLPINEPMGAVGAAFFKGFKEQFSAANVAALKAQNEAVAKIMKDFANHTTSELRNIVDASTSHVNDKIAGYQKLAEQGDLRTHEEVSKARIAMSGNLEALTKLNDTIRSKQVDKAYDLNHDDPTVRSNERRRLANDIGKNIETSKLPDGAWKSKEFMEILRQKIGGRVFENKVRKAYDDTDDDELRDKITANIIKVTDDNKIGLKEDDQTDMRQLVASLNGEIKKAFGDNFDQFTKWVRNAETRGEALNKIKLAEFDEIVKDDVRKGQFAENLNANTFTKMWGRGEGYNEPLMIEMKKIYANHHSQTQINEMLRGNTKARNVWNSLPNFDPGVPPPPSSTPI